MDKAQFSLEALLALCGYLVFVYLLLMALHSFSERLAVDSEVLELRSQLTAEIISFQALELEGVSPQTNGNCSHVGVFACVGARSVVSRPFFSGLNASEKLLHVR